MELLPGVDKKRIYTASEGAASERNKKKKKKMTAQKMAQGKIK